MNKFSKYHKIQTVFKRDEKGRLIFGVWTKQEFEYLASNIWSFEEKIDGTNIRIFYDGDNVLLGGRTDKAVIPKPLLDRLSALFTKDKLSQVFPDASPEATVILFGEGYGNKIQKVGKLYKEDGVDFILFDVLFNGAIYADRAVVADIAKDLAVQKPEIMGWGTIEEAIQIARQPFSSELGSCDAEGFILRPEIELKNKLGGRVICKIKTKDFKRLA